MANPIITAWNQATDDEKCDALLALSRTQKPALEAALEATFGTVTKDAETGRKWWGNRFVDRNRRRQ